MIFSSLLETLHTDITALHRRRFIFGHDREEKAQPEDYKLHARSVAWLPQPRKRDPVQGSTCMREPKAYKGIPSIKARYCKKANVPHLHGTRELPCFLMPAESR